VRLSRQGAYEIEGRGAQLFDRIDGDHFSIIGLPFAAIARLAARSRDVAGIRSRPPPVSMASSGDPVAHSLSPLIHNRWIAEARLDAVYVAAALKSATPRPIYAPWRARAFWPQCHASAQGGGACLSCAHFA